MSQSPSYSRSSSFSGSHSHSHSQDKLVWDELESIQKQFDRMELNRRTKVNLLKLRKSQQLRAEYRLKVKDEHIRNVQQRRVSMDSAKQKERRNVADRKQRKRDSRLRLLETVGTNALKFGHSFERQHQSVNDRRQSVQQRREQIQQQKDEKKKREFREKQRKREEKIQNALHRQSRNKNWNSNKRHNNNTGSGVTGVRPKSACTSFLFDDHETSSKHHDVSDDLSSESPSDFSSAFMQMNANRSKTLTRSMSASFVQFGDSEIEEKPQSTLKSLFRSSSKKKKKRRRGSYGFMKPTLSAYLFTNNPTTMFANC